ncbi:hypothetical protein UFOVP244_14 [uncultured Caudovirales phage]|uniref:Uncharacterized protein n=1 Tax=uncultured Caudovirales phage TaxID=2100421 RepID=A0A6J7WUW5_9CAUD|nr:hypothetical protein UFOVP244_14 [uncultured Caudovirales phage]
MSMTASIKALLNNFSKSQPALNEPGKPSAVSGVKLGDLIEQAETSAVAKAAAYTPANPANWGASAPATVGEALDKLAAAVKALQA